MSYIDQNVWIKNMQDLQNTDRLNPFKEIDEFYTRIIQSNSAPSEEEVKNFNDALIAQSNARRKFINDKIKQRTIRGMIIGSIVAFIIGLFIICIPAHAAFSPEGVNQWAQVFSNARGNPSANYERQRMQQMQEEQHELQMELLKEQINQLKNKKQKSR